MEHDLNHSPASSQILIADDDALAAKAFQRMLAVEGRIVFWKRWWRRASKS